MNFPNILKTTLADAIGGPDQAHSGAIVTTLHEDGVTNTYHDLPHILLIEGDETIEENLQALKDSFPPGAKHVGVQLTTSRLGDEFDEAKTQLFASPESIDLSQHYVAYKGTNYWGQADGFHRSLIVETIVPYEMALLAVANDVLNERMDGWGNHPNRTNSLFINNVAAEGKTPDLVARLRYNPLITMPTTITLLSKTEIEAAINKPVTVDIKQQ